MFWRKPRDIEFGTPRKSIISWEYKTERVFADPTTKDFEKKIIEKLDELGEEGWEPVSTELISSDAGISHSTILLLKRRKV